MQGRTDDESTTSTPLDDAERQAGATDRDVLVLEYLWLAERCAAGYAGRGEHYDDLSQVAMIGLIKAAQHFDPDRGVPFASFAVPTIKGELRHYFRDSSWTVKVPGRVKDLRIELRNAIARLEQTLGRSPGTDELAADLHVAASALEAAVRADVVYEVESLDALSDRRGDESSDQSLTEPETDAFLAATSRVDALHALSYLSERERAMVYWRFFEDRTQQEIADLLGIGQAHVSRLLSGALRDLAQRLALATPSNA